jgi:hypothetical protein
MSTINIHLHLDLLLCGCANFHLTTPSPEQLLPHRKDVDPGSQSQFSDSGLVGHRSFSYPRALGKSFYLSAGDRFAGQILHSGLNTLGGGFRLRCGRGGSNRDTGWVSRARTGIDLQDRMNRLTWSIGNIESLLGKVKPTAHNHQLIRANRQIKARRAFTISFSNRCEHSVGRGYFHTGLWHDRSGLIRSVDSDMGPE